MDKLTSGIIDKLSIIGFFNVFLSGAVLLYGVSPILDKYAPGIFYLHLGLERDFEKGIVVCLLCFLFGCALQSIQEFLFKGLKAAVTNRCLSRSGKFGRNIPVKGVLSNNYHREGTIKLAEKLFSDKNMGEFDPEDKTMCSYFIDYCEYSNSIKGHNYLYSRLSESATFYEQLAVAFYALAVIGILVIVFTGSHVFMYCIGYFIAGFLFTAKAYQCRLNWARSVLSTFEVASDQYSK